MGLGDTVESILEATGIAQVVKAIAPDCGCEERKAALNRAVPYFSPFSAEQKQVWLDIIKPQWEAGNISVDAQKHITDMYQSVFRMRRKISRCSGCAKSMLVRLEQAYEASCEY